eukprot:1666475-Pleurochrysis_carterae.AAC.1
MKKSIPEENGPATNSHNDFLLSGGIINGPGAARANGGGGTRMGSGGQEVRPSPCEVAWNVGQLATAAEAALGTCVLVATDAAAVAGVEEATA